MPQKKSTVIGIVSGKGGVGKSLFAVNASATLARIGQNHLLIDADISNPSVCTHLGISYEKPGLPEALSNKCEPGEAVILHAPTKMNLMPSAVGDSARINLKRLPGLVESLDYDYVVIDSPPGITEDVENIIDSCDKVLIVTTPELASVSSAAKIVRMCRERKKESGIILNRVTGARYEMSNREIEAAAQEKIICEIPEDVAVPQSLAARNPLVLYSPHSPAARQLRMATMVMANEYDDSARPGLWEILIASIRRLLPY